MRILLTTLATLSVGALASGSVWAAPVAKPAARKPAAARPAPPVKPLVGRVAVVFTTDMGAFTVEVDPTRAPITSANFVRYAEQGRYNGQAIYRAMTIAPGQGLIQGGVRDATKLLPPIAHEPTTKTGLTHDAMTVSMARLTPGTAQSDFFIMMSPMKGLDADPTKTGDNQGFAVFGRVVEGMDVVQKIFAAPINPALGEGIMRGQMLAKPVKILRAERVVLMQAPVAPATPAPATTPAADPAPKP